jgi:molybdenum cofactor biosynthesis protein B
VTEPRSGSTAHRAHARDLGPVALAIVTVSDSRTKDDDDNGAWLAEQIERAGHRVCDYRVLPDEPALIVGALEECVAGEAQIVLFNGGTGISKRDSTYDAIAARLEKTLTGFGELFRMLSYEQVGAAAMFSRATAGVLGGTVVISTPGSPAAVQLAWDKLIAPELAHLAWEVAR